MSQLLLQGLVSIFAAVTLLFLLQVVHLDVTGADDRLAPSWLLCCLESLLDEFASIALKVGNWLTSETVVAEAHDRGVACALDHGLSLHIESLSVRVVRLSVFHPVDREEVTEARADLDTVDSVFRRAVSRVRWLCSIRSGKSVDVLVFAKLWEHGARLAGLDVENHLAVQVILLHVVDCLLKSVCVQVFTREGNQAWSAMV